MGMLGANASVIETIARQEINSGNVVQLQPKLVEELKKYSEEQVSMLRRQAAKIVSELPINRIEARLVLVLAWANENRMQTPAELHEAAIQFQNALEQLTLAGFL